MGKGRHRIAGILIGLAAIPHGLVHLLYFGQARRMLYLSTGMTWPDGSPHDLRHQGGIGVLLNLLMLGALRWLRIG